MNKQINQIQESIIEEFSHFNDWFEAYEYLINIGKKLTNMDENLKTEEHAIGGCQSQVWISAQLMDGKIFYEADSDSVLIKGIIALLFEVLNKQDPQSVVSSDLYFIEKIGLKNHLSPTRSNGLFSIINQLKMYANMFNSDNIKE